MKTNLKQMLKQTATIDTMFTALQHVVPQQKLSETAGKLAASQHPWIKKAFVKAFAKAYDISLEEYARKDLESYDSFNDFFTRELDEAARPIDQQSGGIISPADGVISQIGYIDKNQLLQAKGRQYDVGQLMADAQLEIGDYYDGGSFATVYLAPSNYHRVHMPFTGTLVEARYVPGTLFSVNNVTAANVPDLFARNERLVCIFETDFGRAVVVLVGAMIVAGIETVATGRIKRSNTIQTQVYNLTLQKGEELGRFYLGSTAIVIMPKSAGVTWHQDQQSGSVVKMGQLLGVATRQS